MPEPGTGHATIEELKAAAASNRRAGINEQELREIERRRAKGASFESAVVQVLARDRSPDLMDSPNLGHPLSSEQLEALCFVDAASLEALRPIVEERAATNFYPGVE